MKKGNLFKKVLAFVLVLSMVMSVQLPVFGSEGMSGDSLEKIDISTLKSLTALEEYKVVETASAEYNDDDVVRVSIVLKEDSVMDAGYSTEAILDNAEALNHMKKVKKNQKNVEKKLAKAAKKGLEVKQRLAIAANIISAEVAYGDIESIATVEGVKAVIIETQYSPCEAVASDAPNMAVATSAMTGASQAWKEGYTGVGGRIAIIDTGLDIDHQSFNDDAFLYSLAKDKIVEAEKEAAKNNGNKNNGNNGNNKSNGNAGNKNKNKVTPTPVVTPDVTEEIDYVKTYGLLGAEEIERALPYLNAYVATGNKLTVDDVTISHKIPFAFNYVDVSLDVRHVNDTQGEHGSHVAGIATANRFLKVENEGRTEYVDALATVGVAGNAPDAQILVMKVFGKGGGAYDSDYMAAIEDAIVLGCDSVNLSLGSGNAGLVTNKTYQDILNKFVESDTVVVMSAGNSGAWAEQTYYGELYADGVNFDTAGSPGSYVNTFSVASVDNAGSFGYSFTVDGVKYGINESTGYGNAPIVTLAADGDTEYEYVFLDGVGEETEFEGIDVKGKVVFVQRGSISFFVKANNAVKNGAVATIIYNNQPGAAPGLNLTGYEYTAPCVAISQSDAALIKAASTEANGYYTGKLTISDELSAIVSNNDYYTMSSFSSWGVPGALIIKPEIAAPGGLIYSVNGTNNAGGGVDQYELMSGTSMAAPQITGMTAILMKYIRDNNISVVNPETKTALTKRAIAQSLFMSTAAPMYDADGKAYSVLRQGAGLGNVYDAMNSAALVTMRSNATASAADGKVKVELGDDPERTGVYTFSFDLTPITSAKAEYKLSAEVFTQATDGNFLFGETMEVSANVKFLVKGEETDTVKLNKKSVKVDVTIELDDETKEFFDSYLTAGAYVEAYVYADAVGEYSSLSIPVLGYYGSWSEPSMFELGSMFEYKYGLETRPPYLYGVDQNTSVNAFILASTDGDYYFGGNLYANDKEYHPEFASLNNLSGDYIKAVNYRLIRNAGAVGYAITDAETGDVYALKNMGQQYSAYYYTNGATWRNTNSKIGINWAGTDAEGQKLEEGTRVNIDLFAAPEYYCDADGNVDLGELGDGSFFSTSLVIDNTAPTMMALSDDAAGAIGVIAVDNVAIAAVSVFADNGKTLLGSAAVDDTQIATYLGTGFEDGIYVVAVFDYAGNVSLETVFLNIEPTDKVEGVVLSNDSLTLLKNNTAVLEAEVLPGNIINSEVTWTSSDSSVATVDANGVVKAVGTGSCEITATSVLDSSFSATCAVKVIEFNIDINGIVWDESGEVWFSEINLANLPNYTKLTEASVKAPINGLAYGNDGTLYATDIDTTNGVSNLYKVADDFSLEMVGSSSIAYTDIAEAPSLGSNILLATYFNYLVLVDAETGEYAGAFDYLSENELVGVAYEGSIYHPIYGTNMDMYLLLDNAGNVYEEAFINLGGAYYYFMGEKAALLGPTGITCDISYFQSMYYDGTFVYVSNYNESANAVNVYILDIFNSSNIYYAGSFADGVWPVAGLCNLNSGAAAIASQKYIDATINADAVMLTEIAK